MAIMNALSYAAPLRKLVQESQIPLDFITAADGPVGSLLDKVYFTEYALIDSASGTGFFIELVFDGELALGLPGFEGFALVLGSGGDGATRVDAAVLLHGGRVSIRLENIGIALRFPPSILKPAGDSEVQYAQIEAVGAVVLDEDFNLHLEDCDSFSLSPSEVGSSGVVISADGVKVDLSRTETLPEILAAGFDEGFLGIFMHEARVKLPDSWPALAPADLVIKNCAIGSGGFSGKLEANYYDETAKKFLRPDSEIFGIPFRLKHVVLELRRNCFVESEISGQMFLPFFEDWVDVDIGIDLGGNFHVRLSDTDADGLKTVETKVLKLELDSIAFEVHDGILGIKVGGKLTPAFGGLNWPTFTVKELAIDSKGRVHLDGGWLDLTDQRTLDFHGFKIEITKLGFGNSDDGGKWVGFSGALKLVNGLKDGASVEGLRVTWYDDGRDPKVTLNGAGIEFEIPKVLSFKGDVSFRELEDMVTHEKIRRFDGKIKLKLVTPKLEIDGVVVVGSATGLQGRYTFFAIYLDAELPTGILLGNTGLSLFGIAGLFALQMEPNKKPDESWYSLDHSKSWYHRPDIGVTDLVNKWQPRKGSLALGAGVTLGTGADDGYVFNGKFLLALVFPGPIIMLQGSANLLKKRTEGTEDAIFRSLAVFDGRESSVLVGIDAEYKTGKTGEMIEIAAGTEAFFSFTHPDAWYIDVGKQPRDQRIRALFGRFVEVDAYFMLNAHRLAMGAWYGYDRTWNPGPLKITLQAWADGNVMVSFKPAQFHGDLWIHGSVDLEVFGFGLGLTVDARIAADLFTPFHLLGEFSVKIRLPWPLKNVGASVTLEWGIQPDPPPLPLPLQDVAIEHFKTTVNWPLTRKALLLPSYDDGGGFIGSAQGGLVPLVPIPVVPLDARPHLTFGRQVHDDAQVGVNGQDPPQWETIGDPTRGGNQAQARYALRHIRLAKQAASEWKVVASDPGSGVKPYLFGSWAALPASLGGDPGTSAQTRLWLWNLNPFAFTRRSGSEWEEWFAQTFPGYPCIPLLESKEVCFGFESLEPGSLVKSPWTPPGPPGFTLSWSFGPATVRTLSRPGRGGLGTVKILCFPDRAARRGVHIQPAEPGRAFRVVLAHADAPQPSASPVPAVLAPATEPTARSVKVISTVDEVPRVCVDFRERAAGTAQNPWTDQGVRFEVRGADGELLPQGRIERWNVGDPLGLNAGFRLDVALPCAASWVELIVSHRPPFRVLAFDQAGTVVASHAPAGPGGVGPETIRLEGQGIARLEVHAAGNEKLLHRLCFACPLATGPTATGAGPDGQVVGPFFPVNGVLTVVDPNLHEVVVRAPGSFCLEMICVTPDPEAGKPVRREERIQHLREELARWTDEAPVLEPDTSYRLEIETRAELQAPGHSPVTENLLEYAYFQTAGPPGLATLTVPAGTQPETFKSGLDDLVRYVRKTTPPTVPPPGEKPIPFKPLYRAYDVGVEFNETYVETMYRMDRRDLGLYLDDNNHQPVRDAKGRLMVLGNAWGKAQTFTLSEQDKHWVTMIDAATCLPKKLDPQTFAKDSALASSEPGRVLAPDTLYAARLMPLLLHDIFPGPFLGLVPDGWYVEDAGPGGSSSWKVGEVGEPASRFVEQVSLIGGAEPERPGTLLLLADSKGADAGPGQPSEWTDYRLSAYLRSAAGGAVGIVVRHQGPGAGYRFSLDGRVRRLVKLGPGGTTLLGENHFSYQKNRDYLVTIEAIGKSLRAYVDGEPVFEVEDADFVKGRIGLYSCQSPGARFTDVRVDDFRAQAPVVYEFQFITSLFANFFHHLHSYQDQTWQAELRTDAEVGDLLQAEDLLKEAVLPSFSPPLEKEARAYEGLATRALGPAARQNAAQVEVTRMERAGVPFAFLVRSPEPFAADRIELALSGTPRHLPAPEVPGAVKLTDATFGAVLTVEESVSLLVRNAADLSRYRVELRALPGVMAEPAGDPVMLLDRFEGDPVSTLARFTVVDQGTEGAPSDWRVEGGALIQISEIHGGAEPELPGTVALAGDPAWTDYRYTSDLRCDSGGALGVVFRWVDGDNYYRLSFDAGLEVRRLVKSEKGQVSILWEEEKGYTAGEPFRLTVEAVGSRLTGFLGGERLFEVSDATHAAGRVGLYASGNPDARCEAIEVRRPSLDAYALARDGFAAADLGGWGRIDEVPGTQPSNWETSGGELHLSSFVQQQDVPASPGTYAYTGDPGWTDVIYSARLRCQAGGDIGLLFRGRDLANYYRFSMSARQSYRRLVKRVSGKVTVLWEDGASYPPGRAIEVTVMAVGGSLRGFMDGVPLFAVEDGEVPSGRIGLYARDNTDAHFSAVRVFPAGQAYAGWKLDESFDSLVPDRWSFFDGLTKPLPGSWMAEGGALRPAGADPATPRLALTGNPAAADYRLAVRVRPGAAGLVGAVFRFLDTDNGFIFLLDAGSGAQRLVKKVKGQETVLWEGKGPALAGREVGLTFDAVGQRLAGWLDGVELFRQEDADLPAGRVGIFAAGGPDARFTEVRLAEPEWTTWYAFGGEDRLPAGTRVRVHAGPAAGAPPPAEAGVERRFAARPGETGRLRFPAIGAELRVVGPDGPGHHRTFVTPADYISLTDPKVVRRADGTGLVLLPFGGSPLVEGQYRLELTYHRERSDQVHPFSQAGDRSPERAAIDIPWKAR
jgi:hypothetical protein